MTRSTPARAGHLLTVNDVALALQLHRNTVYELLVQGKLPGVRIGRAWRVRQCDLDGYLAGVIYRPKTQTTQTEEKPRRRRGAPVGDIPPLNWAAWQEGA